MAVVLKTGGTTVSVLSQITIIVVMSTHRPHSDIFSKRLKDARQLHGLSQKGLGIAAGIDEFVASARINRY